MFDINDYLEIPQTDKRYEERIDLLKKQGREVWNIEKAVNESVKNIKSGVRSFVIYGEPQSGKTEMMIALTAKLLDVGHKIIIILLNDNVRLLNQNLERFQRSGISPAPVNFSEVLEERIGERSWVIFCKKNASNLLNLLDVVKSKSSKVVIDDEADFASPNAKINTNEKTRINELIYELLKNEGVYIGVTATPARLDLNNTFDNITEKWVDFPPHMNYVGKEVFFPVTTKDSLEFKLRLLPDEGDHPRFLRKALLSFLVNVAILNLTNKKDDNYCFLIHTSGQKVDHSKDYRDILKIFEDLSPTSSSFEKTLREIFEIASERVANPKEVLCYILPKRDSRVVSLLNSERITDTDPTNPPAIFTVAIGGNIVSRGVTFNNLLSMFFTRDSKHRMQQDTYIQRARMFGDRRKYVNFFELWIPEKLYVDWQKCFVYHYLSLSAIKNNSVAPIWMADNRIQPVAKNSIDNKTVVLDDGDVTFKRFIFKKDLENLIYDKNTLAIKKLESLNMIAGEEVFPEFVIDFIKHYSPNGEESVKIHEIYHSEAIDDPHRLKKGLLGGTQGKKMKKYPAALHHIFIAKNVEGGARVVYRYIGNARFFKNLAERS